MNTARDTHRPDAALAAFVRSLAPLQALSGGVRALPISPDRVQSTPSADSGAPSEASDRGTLARARVLSARLARVDVADRVTIEWLVTYAHADAHPDVLAGMLARAAAFDLRDALDHAAAKRKALERDRQRLDVEAAHARQRLRHGATLTTDATVADRLARATAAEQSARGREAEAERALYAWGRARIERAAAAWEDAER